MNRFQAMLDAGYLPGVRYGASPLCACSKRPEYVLGIQGQTTYLCRDCYRKYRATR